MTETKPSQLARRINDTREAVQAQATKAERGHIRRRNLVVFLAALVDRWLDQLEQKAFLDRIA